MSKKLTVKKALQETARIWTRLAESGGNKLGIDFQYLHGCPCCDIYIAKFHFVYLQNVMVLEPAQLSLHLMEIHGGA